MSGLCASRTLCPHAIMRNLAASTKTGRTSTSHQARRLLYRGYRLEKPKGDKRGFKKVVTGHTGRCRGRCRRHGWFSLDRETRGLWPPCPPTAICCSGRSRNATPPSARWMPSAAAPRPTWCPPASPLPRGRPEAQERLDAYMAGQRSCGAAGEPTRSCGWNAMAWTLMPQAADRFSVTSRSLHWWALRSKTALSEPDDKVSVYIPELKASADDDERAATADHDIWREVD